MPKILIISGSVNEKSYTRVLADNIIDALYNKGIEAVHWNLREKPLPIMDPVLRDDVFNHPNDNIRQLATLAQNADGFVWATPLYHNSYSGVLKNAIDHLRTAQFAYKAVGLVSHGDDTGDKQPVDHLRIVARSVYAIAIPTQICTGNVDYTDYVLTNEKIKSRIEKFCDELLIFAEMLKPIREAGAAKKKDK